MNKKILISFFCIILASLIFVVPVFADPPGAGTMKSALSNPWGGNDAIRSSGNTILGIIQLVGNAFAIGTMMMIGIKYMLAAPEEKASLKQRIFPYMIGAILIFGAVNVLKIVADYANIIK